jgi:hypothetical protein
LAAPRVGPLARRDLVARSLLILTSAKATLFCQTQHRALPSLREGALHPEVELQPATADIVEDQPEPAGQRRVLPVNFDVALSILTRPAFC